MTLKTIITLGIKSSLAYDTEMQPVLFNNNLLAVGQNVFSFPRENLFLLVTVGNYYYCILAMVSHSHSAVSSAINNEYNSKHKLSLHFLKLLILFEIPLV